VSLLISATPALSLQVIMSARHGGMLSMDMPIGILQSQAEKPLRK
jgi:hypothetical protein